MNNERPTVDVIHNEAASRFETTVNDHLAVAEYERNDDTLNFSHTLVPQALEGRGIASQLAKTALDYAQTNGLKVIPSCSFFASYIKRHPEYQALVDSKQ